MPGKKVLVVDGGTTYAHSRGELNHTLAHDASEILKELGYEVEVTRVIDDYDPEAEVKKFASSDIVILQMAGWWMGEPWTVKKWIDVVFTTGYSVLYGSDGRTRKEEPKKNYGKGGLLHGKKYMLSLTWNAPLEAFDDPKEFFGGVGVDGLYLHTHKAFQFLAMEPLPTFVCNDVMKEPDVPRDQRRLREHLNNVFPKQ